MEFKPSNIRKEHVLKAINLIKSSNISLKNSKKWEVIIDGYGYPPKEVMRYAREQYDGLKDWNISGGSPTNNLLEKMGFKIIEIQKNMTFIEAAKKVLSDNGNKPLSSREIWDSIEKNGLVKTSGKTPHLSMNSILCGYSSNLEEIVPDRKPRTESEVKNSVFKIVSQNPYKFVIDNYMMPLAKEIMIKNGFITIDILKEILKKNNIDVNID